MEIDKQLNDAARRMQDDLAMVTVPPTPRPSHRPWIATALGAAALTAGIIGVFVIASTPADDNAPAATTQTTIATSVERSRTYISRPLGFSVSYPIDWSRSSEPLAPSSRFQNVETSQILAVGSGQLVEGASTTCRTLPQYAIEAMGADDVLVTVVDAPDPGAPWPDSFGPDVFPDSSDVTDRIRACTERLDIVAWQGRFTIDNEHGTILVVSTLTTPNAELENAWATLDSLELTDTESTQLLFNEPTWTIAYQGDWHRADSSLMRASPWESTTLATFPLIAGGGTCASYPEPSLLAMGDGDALISIVFTGEREARWPERGLNDQTFPAVEGAEANFCISRQDIEIHSGSFLIDSRGLRVLVAFGEDVSDEVRAETWAVVSSLQHTDNRRGGSCIVTVPSEPLWQPPDAWNPSPSNPKTAWFGTADLWTPLPYDGVYTERKSVWWSQSFTDAGLESQPDISVTYESLDTPNFTIESDGLGTNASTPEDGLFMIANIAFEPPSAGCWRVTAEYKGATTSYVVDVP